MKKLSVTQEMEKLRWKPRHLTYRPWLEEWRRRPDFHWGISCNTIVSQNCTGDSKYFTNILLQPWRLWRGPLIQKNISESPFHWNVNAEEIDFNSLAELNLWSQVSSCSCEMLKVLPPILFLLPLHLRVLPAPTLPPSAMQRLVPTFVLCQGCVGNKWHHPHCLWLMRKEERRAAEVNNAFNYDQLFRQRFLSGSNRNRQQDGVTGRRIHWTWSWSNQGHTHSPTAISF